MKVGQGPREISTSSPLGPPWGFNPDGARGEENCVRGQQTGMLISQAILRTTTLSAHAVGPFTQYLRSFHFKSGRSKTAGRVEYCVSRQWPLHDETNNTVSLLYKEKPGRSGLNATTTERAHRVVCDRNNLPRESIPQRVCNSVDFPE